MQALLTSVRVLLQRSRVDWEQLARNFTSNMLTDRLTKYPLPL